ncbi:MAG TPA: LysE family transporter [Thermoanaerobaculia bacterium]|nr:LysE family transporter [Thermoanaerobaculia bacterium]
MLFADVAPLIGKGLLLGWSIAWPPGPINSEMIRRGLSRGFWTAYAVGLGACSGDFLWALAVTLGAGVLAQVRAVEIALAAISFTLLLVLAATFTRNALHGWRVLRAGEEIPRAPAMLDSTRGGYLLGIGMALSSPWNIAFWLAVVGQQAGASLGFASSLLLATAVVVGAAAWGLFLCTAVRLGARFASPRWEIATNALTAVLMLYFAIQLAVRFVSR